MWRKLLPILALWTLLVAPLALRADDELDRIRGIRNVAADKLRSQVNDAIALSRKQERSDPLKAKATLQDMLRSVSNSQDLTAEQSTRLERLLQARVREVERLIALQRVEQNQKPLADRPKSVSVDEPAPKRGPSSLAKDFQNSAKGALTLNQEMIRQREKNVNRVNSSIEKTLRYPTDDAPIVFPKNWASKKPYGQQLTKKEVALIKTLNSVMSVNYDGDKFRAVIDHLQERTGLSIIMDNESMKDAMVEYDDPITFKANKISVRTILKKILGDKGLTYSIREGTLHVMTPKKAAEQVIVRSYPVGDLIQPTNGMMMNPIFYQMQMMSHVQQLINLIQSSTDPAYWQPNGPGTITYFAPSKALIIRASTEMHYQLASPGIFGR